MGGELGEPILPGSSLHKDQVWGALLDEAVFGLGSEGLHTAEVLEVSSSPAVFLGLNH